MIVQVDPEANTKLTVMERLRSMQEEDELCDFTITVNGSQIRAHKCVLAAACDYFHTSFRFSKSSQAVTTMDLTHMGCDVKIVEKVIKSFYSNQIDLEPSCLESLLRLVDYFICENLRLCIESYMENSLNFHTALLYFQLALQYRLNSTGLFNCAKWLLCFRFHDYFIYHPDAAESNTDVLNAFMTYDIFCHCNPLQLVEFFLSNAKLFLERMHYEDAESKPESCRAIRKRLANTFQKLSTLLEQTEPEILERWKPYIADFLKKWSEDNQNLVKFYTELQCHVRVLEIEMSGKDFSPDLLCAKKENCDICYVSMRIHQQNKLMSEGDGEGAAPTCSNPNCQWKDDPAIKSDPNVQLIKVLVCEFESDDEEYKQSEDYCSCTPKPVRDYLISLKQPDPQMEMLRSLFKSPTRDDDNENERRISVNDEPQTLSVTTRPPAPNIVSPEAQLFEILKNDIPLSTLRSDVAASTSKQGRSSQKYRDFIAEKLRSPDTDSSSSSHKRKLDLSGEPSGMCASTSAGAAAAAVNESSNNMEIDASVASVSDPHESKAKILVVLAPSADMAAQIMTIDAGEARPLLKSPQLEVSYFDIEMNTWRQGCKFDLPVHGAMLDKHAWRIAFHDKCLYLFSLGRELGLELDVTCNKWTHLKCKQLFQQHSEHSPVKSVIPISVGDKLIILSMSRESKPDGTFWTRQHFYEMSPTKSFVLTASVQDDRMDVPITQWTVDGDLLVTVKASTMLYRHISRVQYIHVYNSKTRELETHEVICAMEAGIKVLARDGTIYLVDKEGWCRAYNLETSTWTALKRYRCLELCSPLGSMSSDSVFPALTRVTCHAGKSRWEITTSRKSINARMQETIVDGEGELTTLPHPPPPFQFMTAMCTGMMSRSLLDSLGHPQFDYVDHHPLDFSLYSQMGGMLYFD